MNIEYKSIGVLIDENITTDLKLEHLGNKPEIRLRKADLQYAIYKRLVNYHIFNDRELQSILFDLTKKLRQVLTKCWMAQDEIMKYGKFINENINDSEYDPDYFERCARAAMEAQKLNAERNGLIRQIDKLLGESEFTQLEKNYE